MKILLLILINLCIWLPLESRLIPKYTESTTESKSADLASSRVTRSIYEDGSGRGFSKEYDVSNEYTTGQKTRSVFTEMPTARYSIKTTRITRQSQETQSETPNNTTPYPDPQTTPKGSLVKKPIPKFNEMDYDEDFQSKVTRSQTKLAESGEHEDEDFSVDDYDFDINHDEFSGRGKPLEPRVKNKHILEQNFDSETDTTPSTSAGGGPTSVVKTQNKLVAVKVLKKRNGYKVKINKRAAQYNNVKKPSKKASDKTKADYYDEESWTPSATESSEVENKTMDSYEMNEDIDDGKENKHRAI
ncbi:uncharacterized protein LOC113239492 [Hyposmocoma kahamanoa]|uniref:uncharacterized protein LOC113239492 n=1 Tax=Hyposmocoma kahamanoa TaxID=1477025 RepID=UPI000E6D8E63|nr:uncharacterized protein LOC113239492 [Hyposmocoma kahamanoa]